MKYPLAQLLSAAGPAERLLARRGQEPISFAQFEAQAARWHAAALAHGGQRYALFFEDSLDFAAALFGLWQAGKCVLLPADVLPLTLAQLSAQVDGFVGDIPAGPWPQLMPVEPQVLPVWQALDPQAELLQIYSSGSTAAPTAISKSLRQLFSEVAALEQAFGARLGQAEVLGTVSHQHIYGLLFRVLWPLASGRVLQARRQVFVEALAEQTLPFALIASPAHLKRLPELHVQGLQALFSSGGPLPESALPDCQRVFGQAPIEVYGSSETGGVAWRQRSAAQEVWTALPGVQWRVDADNGLLEISSPHLPNLSWTATQDRASRQPSGFELLGRADRVLKIEEKRVSPAAIEACLLATGWLAELRVLSLPGARQQLAVVAVPTPAGWRLHDESGRRHFGERLRAELLKLLEPVAAPRRWRFVEALPQNLQGKTTQAALQALFDPRRPALRLLSHEGMSLTLGLQPEAALPQFDGHFPGSPILPGVAQLDWAIQFGREYFPALLPVFCGLEVLKFQQVIAPGQDLRLQLTCQPDGTRLSFKYESAKGLHASGRILFEAQA